MKDLQAKSGLIERTHNLLSEHNLRDYEDGEMKTAKEDEDKSFSTFISGVLQKNRSVRYDRDIGKLDVMVDDIVGLVAAAMHKTSLQEIVWPYGIIKPCESTDAERGRPASFASTSSSHSLN